MRYALVGYGRMGRAIEAAASARGHDLAAVVDRTARGTRVARSLEDVTWRRIDVAFEFTEPSSAKGHLLALLARGVPVVCGTTGWDPADPEVRRAASRARAGAVIAANYSVGVNLFFAVVEEAARRFLGAGGYDPWVAEWHHRGKADAPSGTARRLARLIAAGAPETRIVEGLPEGSLPPGDVHVGAIRAGLESGRHVVGFDGPDDRVTLEHASRGRDGFARGAVLAAEWLRGKQGIHGFDEVLAGNRKPRARRRSR